MEDKRSSSAAEEKYLKKQEKSKDLTEPERCI